MILIKELIEEVRFLPEATGKGYFIEGIFLQGDVANRNKRRYSIDILERAVNKYVDEHVSKKRAFGELGHPNGPTVNLDRVSHMIQELKRVGSNFEGRAKITVSTPMGAIARSLLDEGATLGVSSRGLGSLKLNREGINEVQDDFFLATAADIVADPSAPDAFVRGIMENKDWMMIDGIWTAQDHDETKRAISEARQHQLEEVMLAQFASFLSKIGAK